MLEFREKMILTGIVERTSQKTGNKYKIVNFLYEYGQTFGAMVDCSIPDGLSQLDKVDVGFKVIPGRYIQLRVTSISKVG